jgi:hypothetical protein
LKNGIVFGILAILYLVFIWLSHPYFIPIFPLLNWAIFGKLLLVFAPVFVIYAWLHRKHLVPRDYHMLYLQFITWVFASFGIKVVTWWLFQGRAVIGPYGRDKGLASMFVEGELVLLVTGLYLLRFAFSKGLSSGQSEVVARRLRSIVLVCVALVPLVMPPLPD